MPETRSRYGNGVAAPWARCAVLGALLVAPRFFGQEIPLVKTVRVSVSTDAVQANQDCRDPAVSGDGRFVAFSSTATNLVPFDTNGVADIFVHDRVTGVTSRVSLSATGEQANGLSREPTLSHDGRYVAFSSTATNLVAGDANGQQDIFRVDRQTGEVQLVSVTSAGAQANAACWAPALTADGGGVVFDTSASNLVASDTNGVSDVFYKIVGGAIKRLSVGESSVQGNDLSSFGSPSADGLLVVLESWASNLVSWDWNGVGDVFVRDRGANTITLVSVSSEGTQGSFSSYGASMGGGAVAGGCVAFMTASNNLVAGDTNGKIDVFVRDLSLGATSRASVATGGTQANGQSLHPSISADCGFVAFDSDANNLVDGDTNAATDVFVCDRATGRTWRASVTSGDAQATGASGYPAISADGRYVVFESSATDLVPGDTNGKIDLFVRDLFLVFADGFESGGLGGWTSHT